MDFMVPPERCVEACGLNNLTGYRNLVSKLGKLGTTDIKMECGELTQGKSIPC